jgi:DNA-binding XRE family transcriptional regulator
MRTTTGPVAARKLIARQLRRLRDTSGMNQTKAAKAIGRSVDTMQRIERGESSIGRSDVIVLCHEYKASPEISEKLLLLQELQRAKAWWQSFAPENSRTLIIELESAANVVEQYDHFFVPGVLQTEAYAEAVIRTVSPDAAIDAQSRLRLGRIERLFSVDDQPNDQSNEQPNVTLIVDESALRRRVGDAKVMREQLEHLLEPPAGCELRVIPFDVGVHPGVVSFTTFGFEDEFLSPVAYVDGVFEGKLLFDEQEDVRKLQQNFARLRKLALNQAKSKELIASIAEDM